MTDRPFQLAIQETSDPNRTQNLLCRRCLRVVEGRREVYEALWNDRPVIVKVFAEANRSTQHVAKEWLGLTRLRQRGFNAPEPLLTGATTDGRAVIVIESIPDASTALARYCRMPDKSGRIQLVRRIVQELARQHEKGIVQHDLHFGNFLLSHDKLFTIDPWQMRFGSEPISKRQALGQLALLGCCLQYGDDDSISDLASEYFRSRHWAFEPADQKELDKQYILCKRKVISQSLKKCLRTSKRIQHIRFGNYLGVFDRVFIEQAEPGEFAEQIDELMAKGEILKNGRTCYVSRLKWNGRDVVVKRYNHKGFVHSLRHTIKRSRARRVWLHTHRLGMLNVATPRPLAYMEYRRGPIVWQSYLVTEYLPGQKLHVFLQDPNVADSQKSAVTTRTRQLLDKLAAWRITHGDLKPSNILIAEMTPAIIDLDSMKIHRWAFTFRKKRAKDIKRFGDSSGSFESG